MLLGNDDLSLRVRNEQVWIDVIEQQDQINHVITKQEEKEIQAFENDKRHNRWATQPRIRKYDYIFNGRLRISIRNGRYFRDTNNSKIESNLGDLLIEIYEESEVVRKDREAREETTRLHEMEARQREERRIRYREEAERTIKLENEAFDYEMACRIRAYIRAVEGHLNHDSVDDETVAWIIRFVSV